MNSTFDLRKFLIENKLTYNSRLLEEKQVLTPEEQKIVDDILSGLDEGAFDNALQKVKAYARKGVLTAAMLTALLAAPNFTQAQKQDIKNVAATEMSTSTTNTSTTKVSVPGSIKAINFNQTFASGKAELTNGGDLQKKVDEVKDFLKGKNISKFKVVVVAGESQVTNPKGFERKGSLAQARAEAVQKVVSDLGFKVDIQTKIGTTPYKPGNDKNSPDYQKEQFVTVNIVVDNNICSMAPVNKKGGQGLEKYDFITYNEYISGKGTLTFAPAQIPDRLVILDADGNIKEDTGYVTTEKSKYGDWKYTPLYVLQLTLKHQSSPNAFTGGKIKTITVTDYNDLLKQLLNNPSAKRYETGGDEIEPALAHMKAMISKGQKEFTIYDLGTAAAVVNFDDARGDVKAVVYSPIGKTGYNIEGSCK